MYELNIKTNMPIMFVTKLQMCIMKQPGHHWTFIKKLNYTETSYLGKIKCPVIRGVCSLYIYMYIKIIHLTEMQRYSYCLGPQH